MMSDNNIETGKLISEYADRTNFRANLFCSIATSFLALLVIMQIIAERYAMGTFFKFTYETALTIAAAAVYALCTVICAIGRFRRPFHRNLLIGGMILAGGLMYTVLNINHGVFLLLPMTAVAIYYSKKMCVRTYIHLLVLATASIIFNFFMDLSYIIDGIVFWDFAFLLFKQYLPEIIHLTALFLFSVYVMNSGRRLMDTVVEDAEKSARKDAEISACAEVQRSALPTNFALAPDGEFEITAGLRSAYETAGDFYDMFVTEDGKLIALVADVSDKGLGSALYMMSVRNTVRSLAHFTSDAEELVTRTNGILCETTDREFVTMFLVCMDPETGKGQYVNAGHNTPFMFRRDGTCVPVESEPQMIMGQFEDAVYSASDITMSCGDMLCVYTDGIPDTLDLSGAEYGTARLAACVSENLGKPLEEIKESLLSDVMSFADDGRFVDDRTVLLLKWN